MHLHTIETMPRQWDPERNIDGDGTGDRNEELCPANGVRADVAEAGIVAAANHRGDSFEMDEAHVTDLLTDLGHYCDREELPFEELVATALRNWEAER